MPRGVGQTQATGVNPNIKLATFTRIILVGKPP